MYSMCIKVLFFVLLRLNIAKDKSLKVSVKVDRKMIFSLFLEMVYLYQNQLLILSILKTGLKTIFNFL